MRKVIYSGTPLEKKASYSRGIKIGNHIWISGTAALNEQGEVVGKDDMYKQVNFAFQKIGNSLKKFNADFSNVVRTSMFITKVDKFEDVIRAHHEVFQGIDPTFTCVVVTALALPELMVEIEVDAFILE